MTFAFADAFTAHQETFAHLDRLQPAVIQAATVLRRCLLEGGKILLCGNGGSAADCQHIAAELVGRFQKERRAYAAIALTTDSSILTAICNDYGPAQVFSRQVEGLAKSGDCLVAISTSGQSENVMRACIQARAMDVYVIGLLGKGGGEIARYCDIALIVRSDSTARIQEAHGFLGHVLCELIEQSS